MPLIAFSFFYGKMVFSEHFDHYRHRQFEFTVSPHLYTHTSRVCANVCLHLSVYQTAMEGVEF